MNGNELKSASVELLSVKAMNVNRGVHMAAIDELDRRANAARAAGNTELATVCANIALDARCKHKIG